MGIAHNRTRLGIAVGLTLICLTLAGCSKSKAPLQGIAPEVAVVVLKAERVPIITELPGRTSAFLIAEVRPQVSGVIQKRLFNEGDDVQFGQPLYQIDPATYEAAYEGAKAALARAEANAVSVASRVGRYKELVAVSAVSNQEYDDAFAALKQAEAEIVGQKAAVENARINLSYTRITAPIGGRIGKSNVTVGALATAYQAPVFTTIQQLDPIYVDATQSSANLLELKRNIAAGRIKGEGPDRAQVKLVLEDGTAYAWEGTLKFSDITVDPSTGSFILRIVFPNPKHILLPGMYVRALVQEGVAEQAILAPQQGISRDPKGNPVALIVNDEGKVEQRMITTDRAIGDKWLVTSGLKPGDRLIVEGLQKVRPGVPVKVASNDRSEKGGAKAAQSGEPPMPKAK
ncbi:MAG TPA: efflux RND transporter periplasmic adaptor subunit [Syntrophorhabdaceae bacterium]|nr:efflux RND transporter periplasmic adaptor subunit [Syntrophorhabdaceae bacterium]